MFSTKFKSISFPYRKAILSLLLFLTAVSLHAQQGEEAKSVLAYMQRAMNFSIFMMDQ